MDKKNAFILTCHGTRKTAQQSLWPLQLKQIIIILSYSDYLLSGLHRQRHVDDRKPRLRNVGRR